MPVPAPQHYAKVICDSIYADGPRLTTFEVRFHRFVLAEFNTHRTFSRNSASSRAIPLAKQLDKVRERPARPVIWAAEQKGMQGGDEIEATDLAQTWWDEASKTATAMASGLGSIGVHKSIANRLLEPFLMHTVVVTATAYDNFFMLRCDPLAQPEIRVAAEAMKEAYDASTPRVLQMGDWHLPYLLPYEISEMEEEGWDARAISSARCARVSYETQAGVRDWSEDMRLYTSLTTNGHASPLEHVATPRPTNKHEVFTGTGSVATGMHLTLPKYGNLLGWHQHRFDVEAARGYQSFS